MVRLLVFLLLVLHASLVSAAEAEKEFSYLPCIGGMPGSIAAEAEWFAPSHLRGERCSTRYASIVDPTLEEWVKIGTRGWKRVVAFTYSKEAAHLARQMGIADVREVAPESDDKFRGIIIVFDER
jgi:hypothetical protein